MYDLVISGGDSFTFGAELTTDVGMLPNSNSWANLVAMRIGKHHINVARSGRSNSYIARHVMHQLDQNRDKNLFVQVMWTFTNRTEFAVSVPTDEYDSPWLGLTPFSHIDETESDWFKLVPNDIPTKTPTYESLKLAYNRNRKLGIIDFAENYARIVQSQSVNDSYTSIKEILLLQNTLQLHNIPYLFSYVNNHVMAGLFDDRVRLPGAKYLTSLRNFVNKDTSNWYRFPGTCQKYMGFDDWAKLNNYKYATSHPLEQAHKDAADLIYTYIKDNNW
jgi:hypothetical protein